MLTSCLLLSLVVPGWVTVDPSDVKPIRGEPIVQPKPKDKTCNSGEVLFCVGNVCQCVVYGET